MQKRLTLLSLALLFLVIFLLPQQPIIPVQGATPDDWNAHSFWYYPWGRSVTHKGIDIFAPLGTPVVSAASGWVLYTGNLRMGGNVVLVLTSQWRLHYYAHLQSSRVATLTWVSSGTQLGTVGDSGNALGKPPHLHYAIVSLVPLVWKMDRSRQGWKKMFYLNPTELLVSQPN